jgi:protein gp37
VSTRTSIEWTRSDDGTAGRTWNPVTGCTKVSEGCGLPRYSGDKSGGCYAENIARRFAGTPAFPHGFAVTLHPERLDDPKRWRAASRVFVNSMSDLFHADIPDAFIAKVFATMAATPQHTYQILTKRPARMRALLARDGQPLLEATEDEASARSLYEAPWPLPNVWLGVSVEDQHWADIRIPVLMRTDAAVRFLSCEPLLGPIDLRASMWTLGSERGHGLTASYVHTGGCCTRLHGLDWVIAGAESGPGARPMDEDWVRVLRDQCTAAGTAFFYKQDADARGRKIPTPHLDGQRWTQFPAQAAA